MILFLLIVLSGLKKNDGFSPEMALKVACQNALL